MNMTTTVDATATRGTATPSRPPTPGGSKTDTTDLIAIKTRTPKGVRESRTHERQAQFDELLAGVYERLRREQVPSHKDQPMTQPPQDPTPAASAATPRWDHIRSRPA